MYQLWECLDPETQTQLVHKGLTMEMNIQILLTNVKDLVLEKRNNLIHRYKFKKMSQIKDKTINKSIARLKDKAELCNFQINLECDCGETIPVSYRDSQILDQLIIGIQEKEWKEKLITIGNNLKLNKAIQVVESLQTGKLSMS